MRPPGSGWHFYGLILVKLVTQASFKALSPRSPTISKPQPEPDSQIYWISTREGGWGNSRRIYSCRDQQHMFQWGSVSLSNSCQLTISHRNLFVCSQDAQSLRICEAGHQIQQTPGSLSSIYHRIQSGPEGPIQNKHWYSLVDWNGQY